MIFDIPNGHDSDILCVDLNNIIFVSGSDDGILKIWSSLHEDPRASSIINIGDKIWSLRISLENEKIAVGSSGYKKSATCHIYDLERYAHLFLFYITIINKYYSCFENK